MTFNEFKAWLEGYCEHIENAPTNEQWTKIRDKLADVRAEPAASPLHPYLAPNPILHNDRAIPWWRQVTCGPSPMVAESKGKLS